MSEMTEQVLVERAADEADKEKKKRRRPNRRSNKHNSSSSGAVCSSPSGANAETIECGVHVTMSNTGSMPIHSALSQNCTFDNHALSEQGLSRASDVGFSSLPPMYIGEEEADLGSMQDQCEPSSNSNETFSKSCPEPIYHEKTNGSSPFIGHTHCHKNKPDADMQRNYFVPYWSANTINEAMQTGEIFKASFRVNAHNRLEAYCTVDGLPIDVFISGVHAQNRA